MGAIPLLGGVKAEIQPKIKLYTTKLVFVGIAAIMFFVPLYAHAGVISFVSNLISGKEADARLLPLGPQINSQNMPLLQANYNPNATGGPEISIVDGSALVQESGVIGTQADLLGSKSTQISLYVVRQGDSLSQIAEMFGVSVNTIVWANDIKRNIIKEGDELVILPITGVSHTVAKGDTLRSIATRYKADMDDILGYNNLSSDTSLTVGMKIMIPDGEVPAPAVQTPAPSSRIASGPLYSDYYLRPIEGGRKSQGLHGNNAVDIAAPTGTPIYASADGTVIVSRASGYNGGYGSYVVISHPNGTQTLYAHASRVLVSQGQAVKRGETIALVGSTGKSTGPHLHFEIRGAVNPF